MASALLVLSMLAGVVGLLDTILGQSATSGIVPMLFAVWFAALARLAQAHQHHRATLEMMEPGRMAALRSSVSQSV